MTDTVAVNWTKKWFDMADPSARFRLIALIEAITWAGLIIGMCFKHLAGAESATMVPGMAHGIAFMIYLGVTLWTATELGWNWKVSTLALLASIPPFFSLIFEWWADRKGHLVDHRVVAQARAARAENEKVEA